MIIWRFENKKEMGPYSSRHIDDDDLQQMFKEHACPETHPNLYSDICIKDNFNTDQNDINFGFESYESLYNWFGKYIPILERNGYKIKKFKVPSRYVNVYKKQVIFRREFATIIQ